MILQLQAHAAAGIMILVMIGAFPGGAAGNWVLGSALLWQCDPLSQQGKFFNINQI
jgi:hypothetical protein